MIVNTVRAGIIGVLVTLAIATPARAALTEAPRLAAVYDAILQARFDLAEQRLKQACPPAPAEACLTLTAVALWWQILLEPESHALDARFERVTSVAITAADAWTRREPRRAEAWFYLAGSYAPLVQWRVLRGERLAAAREGKKIKDALERALAIDPTLHDAYFGIGLYHYYADVAPAALKIVRWLLLLPGGDRVQGLREMLQARERGELIRSEADYQLHWLYLWYEQKPEAALALLRGLDARYPSNPIFLQRIAEVQHEYFHDHRAAAASWEALLDRARSGIASAARLAEVRARLGLAAELLENFSSRARYRAPDDHHRHEPNRAVLRARARATPSRRGLRSPWSSRSGSRGVSSRTRTGAGARSDRCAPPCTCGAAAPPAREMIFFLTT